MKKLRLQVDLDEYRMTLLDDLRRRIGATSRGEVLRNSLAFYDWAVSHAVRGRRIAAVADDDKPMEVFAVPVAGKAEPVHDYLLDAGIGPV